ncbi:Manganese transport system membrane protein MntB [Gemmata obscuriglobus]|uniref:Metal ABC transporter permease n=1 Tax=Gemmata obscuriglobus TaxID=114 RepID=A0A2Z3H3Y3_9BACT|nr:metal ABC transporter permease [Gemmata obscuriglobus]AWM38437.1 metal ABC transporter permease [Gemmata obscuriglobus]QEG28639.1 Manganese transport system membrane protein MntB [Gemmata obscuriglobus]VTS06834.1 abc 3 transport family protein : Transcriptional regulator, MarR family OS=Roseiflexus castenholzii (strain DSM 13941 / HLO8) GN=Rcas_1721 PE=3 SV=1: ABC-3 [Gemmata obscuriglobus UQM 2246]
MSPVVELSLVLAVVAAACALPGAFLVLRRSAMTSDAIGHVLLFGIVLAYFTVRDLGSPWLLFGAAAAGVLAVVLVEALEKSGRVKADAALGLVFAALFAAGVLMVSVSVKNVHLDVDQVLLGQPEAARDPRWNAFDFAISPVWILGAVLALNVLLATLFFKELKLTTFDPGLAASIGFRPVVIHYSLMVVVSVTAVAAFDAVGPVLVVGFFVVPAAAAFLLTDRLAVMLALAALFGVVAAFVGTAAADTLNTTTAGAVAVALGGLFAIVFLVAPRRGLVAQAVERVRQKRAFHELMLAVHLAQHEGTPEEIEESRAASLHTHLHWSPQQTAVVVARAARNGFVVCADGGLKLTESGRARAREVLGQGSRTMK